MDNLLLKFHNNISDNLDILYNECKTLVIDLSITQLNFKLFELPPCVRCLHVRRVYLVYI